MIRTCHLETPIGMLCISASEVAVTELSFCEERGCATENRESLPPLLEQAVRELTEYFAGERSDFTLPLAVAGTPFRQAVWTALQTIPCGQTRTYGQIAAQIGRPRAARAVGMACNRNPIGIIIPCHRVLGANGTLTGYAGGVAKKASLIRLEQAHT